MMPPALARSKEKGIKFAGMFFFLHQPAARRTGRRRR